jgi:predicted esterase
MAPRLLGTGSDFDAVWRQLKSGRRYAAQPTGRRPLPTTVNGVALDNVAEIPVQYDPARTWQLRVQLHGGVGREAPAPGAEVRPLTDRTPGSTEIVLHPRAWSGSEWWTAVGVDNMMQLVDRVKRSYNVDTSHVYVSGISDGGTGVYFLAMRLATPWSACVALNGHPMVLASVSTGADGDMFMGNLANCPLYIVNGGRDRLYPARSVAPIVAVMKRAAPSLLFHVHEEAGHDVSWWPLERQQYEEFIRTHARPAHPERVSWETERTDRYNRIRWLVIDRLGARASDVPLEDVNNFGSKADPDAMLYTRNHRSGRVDVARTGNTFDAKTRGVQEFTLLLSPDVVNFERPVQVTVNGKVVHNGAVKRDVATLLKWAARDNDPAMLYGAALKIAVP